VATFKKDGFMSTVEDSTLGKISPNEGYILKKLIHLPFGKELSGGSESWINELGPKLQPIGLKLAGLDPINQTALSDDDRITIQILKKFEMWDKLRAFGIER
jgi:hypothetical protein